VMERVGEVVLLPEAQMMLAQISSGAMPAYIALIAEAQIDALVRNGLDAGTAGRLVIGSIPGAAKLLGRGGDTLAVRRAVTSPGGTTAQALAALEAGGVRAAFSKAADVIAAPPR
jgi:pyrroline-5-carboxylate reductase